MTTPTPKQLVVQSLKSLHKARIKSQLRIRAIRLHRKDLNREERALQAQVKAAKDKIDWEISRNGRLLQDLQ